MRYTTIIVDDDEDDRETLQKALQQNNVSSIGVFENPLPLFKYLEQAEELPQLIITDYNMPVVNGEALLARIKSQERFKDIAIVVMSSTKPPEVPGRCMQLGALEWYLKPYKDEETDAVIKQLLPIIKTA